MTYDIYNQYNNYTGLVAPFNLQPDAKGKHLQSSVVRKSDIVFEIVVLEFF